MPTGAEVVKVGFDPTGGLAIWALIDSAVQHTEPRRFQLVGTGHSILDNVKYLDSVIEPPFVWHILEVIE